MLNEIISNLKQTVPDAFKEMEKPYIPWIKEKSEIIDLYKSYPFYREHKIFPTIFIDPGTKIIKKDEELEIEIREIGIEALAWYVSYHQGKKWGIYFRIRGLLYLSNQFKYKNNINDINERIKIALDLLFYHEFFHFLTDMVSAHMEMVYKKAIYKHYIKFIRFLENYKDKAFINLYIEEPLANIYSLKRMPKKYHYRIKNFFYIQPEPYSQFFNFLSENDFIMGKRKLGGIFNTLKFVPDSIYDLKIDKQIRKRREKLINNILQGLKDILLKIDEPFWEFLFNIEPEKLYLSDIPIYFVTEEHPNGKLRFITPITCGTKIAAYPCDHPLTHIHVWIPANNRKDGRYLYPSLKPYLGSERLSNTKRKRVEKVIEKYKDKIERNLRKQKQSW